MTTARDLITDAAYASGALGQDQSISAADAALCLRALQRMVDSWSNRNLTVYTVAESTFSCVGGTVSYATSAWTPTTRPVSIQNIWLRQGTIDYPIPEITKEEYDEIPNKSAEGLPMCAMYLPAATTGTLYFYPTPDTTYAVKVNGRFPLASGMTLDTVISLPPGYEAALLANLAVEIGPYFGAQPNAVMMQKANETLDALALTNFVPQVLDTGLPGTGYSRPGYLRILGDT